MSTENRHKKIVEIVQDKLTYSEVKTLGKLPNFEISEIKLFDETPNDLTYPLIQPFLHKKVLEVISKV